ncbi:MAG: TonB-dependent receptor, partial [Bacteroidota bacterium]
VTAKRYAITTSSLSQWGIGDLTPTFSDESYGFGTSLKFSFSPDRFIRLSYENATRIPESREYFGDGAFLIGNPLLNPEQSHNINLGLYTNLDQNKDWWLDVNAFYRHVQDQIILQPLWLIFSQYQNKDEAKIQGVEASVRTTLFDKLKISANITYQDARRFNIETRSEQVMEGARLPFRPFFYTNLNFNYDLHGLFGSSNRLSLYSNYSFVEKYIFIQIPQSQEPGIFENVEGSQLSNLEDFLIPTQHMVNAGASYKFNDLPLWLNLEVNNALNLELYDNFRIPKQPINYNIKIRYQLK